MPVEIDEKALQRLLQNTKKAQRGEDIETSNIDEWAVMVAENALNDS